MESNALEFELFGLCKLDNAASSTQTFHRSRWSAVDFAERFWPGISELRRERRKKS